MDDIKRFEAKLDKIDDNIGRIDITLASQHEVLKEHIKRSNMLEAQMAPIQAHVSKVEGAIKLISILAMIAAIISVVYQVIK